MNFSSKLPATFLIVTLTLSGAAVATAQTNDTAQHGGGPGVLMARLSEIDTNGDGAVSQAEVDAFRAARLAAADTDGDGALSEEEWIAAAQQAREDRHGRAFDRLDADGDGRVTQAETDAVMGDIVARRDRNGDGQLSREDRPLRGEHRGPRGGGFGHRGGN